MGPYKCIQTRYLVPKPNQTRCQRINPHLADGKCSLWILDTFICSNLYCVLLQSTVRTCDHPQSEYHKDESIKAETRLFSTVCIPSETKPSETGDLLCCVITRSQTDHDAGRLVSGARPHRLCVCVCFGFSCRCLSCRDTP